MQGDLSAMGQAAAGQLATGGAALDARNKNFSGLLGIGSQEQMQQQRELDSAKGEWDKAQNHDIEQLNVLLSSLGMSPYGKSESTDKVTSGGGGTDFAQMGTGIISILGALFGLSDERTKTDIEKVGVNEATGIPIYDYRYKGDPKNSPKIRGPMAQDVEAVFPEHVIEVNGIKAVDRRVLGVLSNV